MNQTAKFKRLMDRISDLEREALKISEEFGELFSPPLADSVGGVFQVVKGRFKRQEIEVDRLRQSSIFVQPGYQLRSVRIQGPTDSLSAAVMESGAGPDDEVKLSVIPNVRLIEIPHPEFRIEKLVPEHELYIKELKEQDNNEAKLTPEEEARRINELTGRN